MVNKLYYPVIGGVENHVRDLANGLSSQIDVKVLVANTSFQTAKEEIDGVEVHKVANLGTFKSTPLAPTFPCWLRKLKSDVYHFHFPYPFGEFSYLLAKPSGKLVITYHSDIIRQKFLLSLYNPFLRAFLKRADKILVSSPNMIEHSPFLNRVKEKCVVVPFGIDTERFEFTEEVSNKAGDIRNRYGDRIVLFVGRLIYYKGVEYLVRAMKAVDGQLLLVGEGSLKDDLKELALNLGIGDRVHFIGEVTDDALPAYYHACDVFVLPSVARSEAFGLVQLEAHTCGKPVVSTNLTTGVPYANLDGVTGIIIPPCSPEELSNAINKLLNDERLRNKYGANGKKRVHEEFTKELMAKRVLEIYKELMV
ncbi:glycosyltransferase [Candidatus Oleimmundimicrobium sp.]|uniref:glycosyltransferase n=1 Tax=Candidatus Oleimmundimicrobium sp. TaxID=3060597 RepID=UPI00272433B0|nr:glycosyltransferase [Candidatus Oleimmundimicrobium sp.]MDO8886410.1 glycosyltransferase [Candidatus Oleimmundimicrobium sp.]